MQMMQSNERGKKIDAALAIGVSMVALRTRIELCQVSAGVELIS